MEETDQKSSVPQATIDDKIFNFAFIMAMRDATQQQAFPAANKKLLWEKADETVVAYRLLKGYINDILDKDKQEQDFYEIEKDIEKAVNEFIKTNGIKKVTKTDEPESIEDAVFSNVQFRTTQMSKFYSIINSIYQAKEAKSKSKLQHYLILISVLSLFLVLLFIYVYQQIHKLYRIKEELSRTNGRLMQLNDELHEKNTQLTDSNIIKEQYIARFFDLCSMYIDKLEDYRKSLNKLAQNRQIDELYKQLKSTSMMENELDELYKTYGYCLNTLHSYEFDGSAGLAKMQSIMQAFRGNIKAFGGKKVVKLLDYAYGLDGLPKSEVLKFLLEDNCSIVVRPSGTEPKLKIYISVSAENREAAEKVECEIVKDAEKWFA